MKISGLHPWRVLFTRTGVQECAFIKNKTLGNSIACGPRPTVPYRERDGYIFYIFWLFPHIQTASVQFSSVAQSCPTLCDPMNLSKPGLPVHHQLPEFTQTHVHRVGDAIQASHPVIPFSSCLQSLPTSESFSNESTLAWGGQSTGVSALASFLPKNTQDWSLLEWNSWISLQSKGLSRVFSNTTVQKHQFFSSQLSSQPNSHIHTWPQEKP